GSAWDARLCAIVIGISGFVAARPRTAPGMESCKKRSALPLSNPLRNTSKATPSVSAMSCSDLIGRRWSCSPRICACWRSGRQVFLCGNGGSAGNASHMANDYLYPVSKTKGSAIRAHALTENPAVLTCLGNDEGYDEIFSFQLAALANKGDLLL